MTEDQLAILAAARQYAEIEYAASAQPEPINLLRGLVKAVNRAGGQDAAIAAAAQGLVLLGYQPNVVSVLWLVKDALLGVVPQEPDLQKLQPGRAP